MWKSLWIHSINPLQNLLVFVCLHIHRSIDLQYLSTYLCIYIYIYTYLLASIFLFVYISTFPSLLSSGPILSVLSYSPFLSCLILSFYLSRYRPSCPIILSILSIFSILSIVSTLSIVSILSIFSIYVFVHLFVCVLFICFSIYCILFD